jgi:hypothetical protein
MRHLHSSPQCVRVALLSVILGRLDGVAHRCFRRFRSEQLSLCRGRPLAPTCGLYSDGSDYMLHYAMASIRYQNNQLSFGLPKISARLPANGYHPDCTV